MTTGHIMMAMTLDGFVARKDHSLDWLMKQKTDGEDHGFAEFQRSIDVIVMGSGSFRTVLDFEQWPYEKRVIVLSKTLDQRDIPSPLAEKVEISSHTPQTLMSSLSARNFKRAYVDGGAVIQSFLKEGLICDMKITIVPILIGEGIRIFGDLLHDIDLTLEGSKQFQSGLVDLTYSIQDRRT
ncbi:dihydrofolate reductase family protein [uncultured Tateyamaria sp.]|uniref:dihydrofolate reductase family protein n=1 Tax=uncultured Tateyamaria sp. TaxID=455651 RepID=UPI002618F9F6|nr:dihydrofolate reductase family protein [uncultured Tateyamaria sp.]